MFTTARKDGSSSVPLLFQSIVLSLLCMIALSACATNAGIFAGGTWQASGLQHSQIRVLTVDSNNPQYLYAGDEQGHVLTSTDGGLHWMDHSSGLPLPNAIHALSFDATGKKLFAATDNGLFVSIDAAQHWSAVGENAKGLTSHMFTALAFDLNAPHTIYVAAQHGVFMSTDDGTIWSSISKGIATNATINNLTFDSDNHRLWAATSLGVYRSDNRGASWQALNTGIPAHIDIYTIQPASISGGTPGLIFAGTSQGFLRSTDTGAHWAESLQSLAKTQVHAVFVDFRTPTTLYVGTDVGVLRSDDSGQSWSGIASGLPRGHSIYAIELGGTDYTQLLAAADDIYLFPGTSGGFNFTRLLPIVLIVLLFLVFYRFTRRNRRSKSALLNPERIVTQPERKEADEPKSNHLT
jgi:photosystem II stability/assembly factor-like uncharacterized protein